MKGRTWLPTEAEAEQELRSFFVVVPDDFEVLRSRVVGEAIARRLGIKWSWKLAVIVRSALRRMGAVEVNFDNVRLWKRLRPKHFDRADAVRLSNAIRKRKRPVPEPTGDAA